MRCCLMNWLRRFMYGRYGSDPLNFVVLGAALVISFLTFPFSGYIAIALIIYAFFRMFSRNIYKRQAENAAFMKFINKWFSIFKYDRARAQEKKYYKFYKCPSCKQQLRVPKGKGKILITCPQCKTKFYKKT